MQLIAEKKSRTDKYDHLRCVRADGTVDGVPMPRQGILPHDLVHYVVESALPLAHGFLSLVARGAQLAFVMEAAHDRSNRQVAQQTIQAEAIVEALQSQLWNGSFDRAAFIEGVHGACLVRDCPAFDFADMDIDAVLYQPALQLNEQWSDLPYYGSLTLTFNETSI